MRWRGQGRHREGTPPRGAGAAGARIGAGHRRLRGAAAGAEGRARPDRAHRRDLRREPQLRPSVRAVPRRERPRQRHAGADDAGRPRRQADAGTAARVEGQGSRSRVPVPGGEQAVPARRAAVQPAADQAGAQRRAQVLPEHRADQRRAQRPLRRRLRRRRLRHGLLRRQQAAAVAVGEGVHARRQLLHGGVRRLVSQPPVARLRVHAARRERAGEHARAGRRARLAQAQAGVAGLGARRRPRRVRRRT